MGDGVVPARSLGEGHWARGGDDHSQWWKDVDQETSGYGASRHIVLQLPGYPAK